MMWKKEERKETRSSDTESDFVTLTTVFSLKVRKVKCQVNTLASQRINNSLKEEKIKSLEQSKAIFFHSVVYFLGLICI